MSVREGRSAGPSAWGCETGGQQARELLHLAHLVADGSGRDDRLLAAQGAGAADHHGSALQRALRGVVGRGADLVDDVAHQPGVVVEGGEHEGSVAPGVLALPVEVSLGLKDLDGLLSKVGEVVLADGQQGVVVLC